MKDLLLSRKFWTAILILAVVVVSAFQAEFKLDAENGAGMIVIAVSYIIGVAVDPGPGGWKGVLQSRKFWAALLGFLIMVLDAFHVLLPFDLTVDQLVMVAVTIGGFISGVALEKPKTLKTE